MKKILVSILFTVLFVALYAQQVDLVKVQASKMTKEVENNVVKPADYMQTNQYPVVYLLHGFGGNHNDWPNIVPQIKKLATLYQIIVVCPNGANSWYFDSPINPEIQYETYVTKDLVNYIDANYSTLKHRNGRAICGLSMGGHGALYLGIRHKDLFSVAGSMSGGVDITQTSQPFELEKVLGPKESNEALWKSASAIAQVDNLKNKELNLLVDCGVEDMFAASNRELHQKLTEKGIAHDYTVRPGNHNWEYWANAIQYQLLYASLTFKKLASTEVAGGKIFFYDAPAEGIYDPSYTSVTAPSQLPGSNGKLTAVTDIKQSGENSLRLSWQSATGGSWAACVAAAGWAEQDLSRISEIRFWVYSPNAIAADALPQVYFQNTQYALSGKLKMGNYLAAGLAAGQWTEVVVPVMDLVKDAPTYNLRSSKSLFFAQDKPDHAAHTMYIDNITLINDPNYQAPAELLLFKDSGSEAFYDQSWVNVTYPSTVEQPVGHAEKLAVETTIKHEGNHSLRLTYKSATGGNWLALVAAIGWTSFDLTAADYEIRFWVRSATDVSGKALPKLYFEAFTGGTCGKLNMSDYVSVLRANEWTEVVIPISAFRTADPTFAKWDKIKGLFLAQNEVDNASHTLYLDDIRFVKEGTGTSIKNTLAQHAATPTAYYKDGAIYYENLQDTAQVYNQSGVKQLQFKPEAANGSYAYALTGGIYILSAGAGGSCKFVVK